MDFNTIYKLEFEPEIRLVLCDCPVKAGFPSPAEDFDIADMSLNEILIKHPNATYLMKVKGDSMLPELQTGDIVIVDRSMEPKSNMMVVASIEGEFTVKRIMIYKDEVHLCPSNPEYKNIIVRKGQDLLVWGVVTGVIRRFA